MGQLSAVGSIGAPHSAQIEVVCAGVDRVEYKLAEKRTVRGWFADVGANLIVNFSTIALLGALIVGYAFLGKAASNAETTVGIASAFERRGEVRDAAQRDGDLSDRQSSADEQKRD